MRHLKFKPCSIVFFYLVLGALLASSGCSQRVRRPANYPKYEVKFAGETDLQKQHIEKNCAFGVPELSRFWNFGPTELIYREGYVLQHSSLDKIPIWVCEGYSESQLSGPGDRDHSDFKPDPDLKGPKAKQSDYKNSGYDRGHMAPAGDFKLNQKLMDESHYLSNIAPQIGPKFNRGVWKDLEEEVRSWLEDDDLGYEKIYVMTGGFFYDPQEEVAATADGWIDYRSIGSNDVSVPTHFFKIITGRNSAGQWRTTSFVMENKAHSKSTTLKEKIVSVKWIEDRTGINFMPGLDENEDLQTRLELVEGSMWSGDSN